jgi:hypothetical protein
MAKQPLTHEEEASRGGARSVATVGVVAVVLAVWGLYVGFSGRKHVEHAAPSAPQSNTESPATTGAPNP